MKFAKELERDLIPEWQAKYFDYSAGKKKIKAVDRALKNLNRSPFPRTPVRRRRESGTTPSSLRNVQRSSSAKPDLADRRDASSAVAIPRNERSPLRQDKPRMERYGSIIGSPPEDEGAHISRATTNLSKRTAPILELPEPAITAENGASATESRNETPTTSHSNQPMLGGHAREPTERTNAFEVGTTRSPTTGQPSLVNRHLSIFHPRRANSVSGAEGGRSLKKLLSPSRNGNSTPRIDRSPDVPLEAYRDVETRQKEFFSFLDKELDKVETFYRTKEEEATQRLNVLRDQLHIMRDRRLDELLRAQQVKQHHNSVDDRTNGNRANGANGLDNDEPKNHGEGRLSWRDPFHSALNATRGGHFGKTTKALKTLGTPRALRGQEQHLDSHRDYSRRTQPPEVPYRLAKRKLKVALIEFYRGLELLKSYALLNRTAFRKINKKYDKTVNAKPPLRYMNERVSNAWFVRSDVVEGHIRTVEDLYTRYFERGNHKVAVGKLRVKSARAGDYTDSMFRCGSCLGIALALGIEGLVRGIDLLYSSDSVLALNTSYLLQIYAGYFLMLFLMFLFCLDCELWTRSKINYVFIFEFDTRHCLDWRQLCEIPCLFALLLGLIVWLNFNRFVDDTMYIYWPVILIGLSVALLFLPAPAVYHRSREWFLNSMFRLSLSGAYPVEFRDFFLGDQFCSQTYALGNIELFFCLYAQHWSNPPLCNSSHSRLLGFFSALPGVWRALQCLRRYADTRNKFPHLVNMGKYTCTILYYVTLSCWRIDKGLTWFALFITFASVNAIYCTFWDLIMDWSLMDPHAHYPFLRNVLGYKQIWMYYVGMAVDPVIRFNWIFYVIFRNDAQHSTIVSFFIAFTEVMRRGLWDIFRVENEHCTNVGRFRASRDIPLPFEIPSAISSPSDIAIGADGHRSSDGPTATATGADVEAGRTPGTIASVSSTRRRGKSFASRPSPMLRGFSRVGTALHEAHAQDFERKRRPELEDTGKVHDDDDSDDDDAADDEHLRKDKDGDGHLEEEVAEAEGLIESRQEQYEIMEGRRESAHDILG